MNLTALSTEVDLTPTLDRLCGDAALLLELLDMLLLEFKNEQADFLEHLEQQDYSWLSTRAHYYKGISANLGLMNFTATARNLELHAQSGDAVKCADSINTLVEAAGQIEQLLLLVPKT